MREYPSQHALRPIMLIINPIMHSWHETETRLVARGVVGGGGGGVGGRHVSFAKWCDQ